MSELFNILVIITVVALVVVRQFSDRRIGETRRWWLLPAVLFVVALRSDGAIDPHHETLSAAMLGAALVAGLATGAGWGWTARLWQGPDDSVWSRGTRATLFVWAGGIAVRVSLAVAAVLLGVHQGTAALLVSLAAMLLARGGVLALRAKDLRGRHGTTTGPQAGEASVAAFGTASKGGA
ncbi:DUF1453 domain-containing protein [Streptomyces sp. NPDC059166]|uniref:DUF1453 domain-containing protein n=1 Tax=Streptomyces sp. NPDC059166 TaxID=3346752 RepID=UPI0036984CE2